MNINVHNYWAFVFPTCNRLFESGVDLGGFLIQLTKIFLLMIPCYSWYHVVDLIRVIKFQSAIERRQGWGQQTAKQKFARTVHFVAIARMANSYTFESAFLVIYQWKYRNNCMSNDLLLLALLLVSFIYLIDEILSLMTESVRLSHGNCNNSGNSIWHSSCSSRSQPQYVWTQQAEPIS